MSAVSGRLGSGPAKIIGRRVASLSPAVAQTEELPQMPHCDFKPQPYQGNTYDDTRNIRQSNLNPALFTFYKKPLLIHQGHMQWLYDHEGYRYLDMFGGIVTVSVGHCHPKVNKALHDQTNMLWHTTNIYMHPKIHEYAEKLTAKLPDPLKVVYFVNSGSDANDLAILMSRLHTGAFEVLSLRNGYHGASPTLMGVTAMSTWRFSTPTGFGVTQTMNPDVYRGPWGGAQCRDSPVQTDRKCNCSPGTCQAGDLYFDQVKDTLLYSTPKKGLAAFFAESIQGVGGTIQYPKGFLKKAFDLVKSKGGVCISDEVQTGFGRTGEHFWGFQSHDVTPDIVTMAKGMGNGFPLGAVVTTPEIAATMSQALHFNTYGGNPMSCAVGSAVLDVIEEDKTQENSAVVGTDFLNKLATLREEFECVGDVRGKGLMIGVEMVTDKETKEPLPAEDFGTIWELSKEMGVLFGKGGIHGNVFRIKPPMCITSEDVDFAVDVLRKSIEMWKSSKV